MLAITVQIQLLQSKSKKSNKKSKGDTTRIDSNLQIAVMNNRHVILTRLNKGIEVLPIVRPNTKHRMGSNYAKCINCIQQTSQ